MIAPSSSPTPLSRPRRSVTPLEAQWLACAGRMAAAGKAAAGPLYGTESGRVALGKGAGGDHTLAIDRDCEAAMQAVLASEAPAPYLLVSEEAGFSGRRGAPWRVVVDPLDGSLNAKRGLEPFCASIAVAEGETLGDVRVGYVEDYTRPRCFAAVMGAGLLCAGTVPNLLADGASTAGVLGASGAPIEQERFDRRALEVVLLEAGRPDRYSFSYRALGALSGADKSEDMRIRQIGSLALSLCYVAVGIADILVAAVRSRSVDLAAGLLILAEAGGGVAALGDDDIWQQPLDLSRRCALMAWRAGLDSDELVSRWRAVGPTLLADA